MAKKRKESSPEPVNESEHNKKETTAQLRTVKHKEAVLSALEEACGIVTVACKTADVGRTQFYKWLKDDPEFAAQVRDISEIAKDFVESKLMQNIENNDVASIIFYLKSKAKDRGYVERQEIEHDASVNKRISLIIKADEEV